MMSPTSLRSVVRSESLSDEPANVRKHLVTSGFAAVDVILGDSATASAGGTAINVARASRRLGWSVDVVGTVGADPAGDLIVSTLRHEGIGVAHLRQDERWTTPVVLQERRHGDHVWRFRCPVCGARYAKHRPSPSGFADQIDREIGSPNVFFFDRVSLFTLALAERWSGQGASVVFEPAGLGRPHLFDAATAVADVVKFSAERSTQFGDRVALHRGLTVETLGAGGARFTTALDAGWTHVGGRKVQNLVDSAGAGDWTTAGLLDALFAVPQTQRIVPSHVRSALRAGQVLGAAACEWEGVFPGKDLTMPASAFESFSCPREVSRHAFVEKEVPEELIAL